MEVLKLAKLKKNDEGLLVLRDIDLSLQAGEILCLLGPSGCGKTTLLRLICGLEKPDSGRVYYRGRDITDVAPHLRQIGVMFQEFALFPHQNVFENIAFGLRVQRQPESDIGRRVGELLELVGLSGKGDRNVSDLSGGERQRVALARSLAPEPGLLLLDEPMGSLDRVLRERLLQDLKQILKQVRTTAIFVTHDHTEAFSVADRIAVVNDGRIEQLDRPEMIYRSPANRFVASFLGFQNLYEGAVQQDSGIATPFGVLPVSGPDPQTGRRLTVLIRPESARLLEHNQAATPAEFEIRGTLKDVRFLGTNYQLTVAFEQGELLVAQLPNDIEVPEVSRNIRLAVALSSVSLIQ